MITESIDSTFAKADGSRPVTPSYVLITPARNEVAFIELTLKSVVAQTAKPLRWVIVSDGSTDGTDDIVSRYSAHYPWIELVRMPERKERHFAGKVHAFNAGYARVRDLSFEILGNLDADISFDADYFSFLLSRFQQDPSLGVGGTPFSESGATYDYRYASTDHVSGACQLFRRECFEGVGGYVPLKRGGVDLLAVLSARMNGWQTRTFTEKVCIHNKKTQADKHNNLRGAVRSGYHDYLMGSHPLWQLFRSIYHMGKRPILVGGILLLAGYVWAMITRAEKSVSAPMAQFRGKEQISRLKNLFKDNLLFIFSPRAARKRA